MSVFEKFAGIGSMVENLTKEKPTITLISNESLCAENYKSVKFFCPESIIVEFDRFDFTVSGLDLTIEYFSPMRLILKGTLCNILYTYVKEGENECEFDIVEE